MGLKKDKIYSGEQEMSLVSGKIFIFYTCAVTVFLFLLSCTHSETKETSDIDSMKGTVKETSDADSIKGVVKGIWMAENDSNHFWLIGDRLLFDVSFYEDSDASIGRYSWYISDSCPSEVNTKKEAGDESLDEEYFVLVVGGQPLCYSILNNNDSILSLLYLGNGTLSLWKRIDEYAP